MLKATLAFSKLKLCLFANEIFGGFQNNFKSFDQINFLHNMKVVGLEKLNNFYFGHLFI